MKRILMAALALTFITGSLGAQEGEKKRKGFPLGKIAFFTAAGIALAATAHPDWRPDPERFTLNNPRTRHHLLAGFAIQSALQFITGKRSGDVFLGGNSIHLLYETKDALRRPGNAPIGNGLGFGFSDQLAYTGGQAAAWLLMPGPGWIFGRHKSPVPEIQNGSSGGSCTPSSAPEPPPAGGSARGGPRLQASSFASFDAFCMQNPRP